MAMFLNVVLLNHEFTHALSVSHSINKVTMLVYMQHRNLTSRFMAMFIYAILVTLSLSYFTHAILANPNHRFKQIKTKTVWYL